MAARIRKRVVFPPPMAQESKALFLNPLYIEKYPFLGYKFNRHIYIPLNGQTVTNWEILLEFSDPVNDIEVWVVKATQIDQDGLLWKFTSLDNQAGFRVF